jgi:hypothetical protein
MANTAVGAPRLPRLPRLPHLPHLTGDIVTISITGDTPIGVVLAAGLLQLVFSAHPSSLFHKILRDVQL